MDVTRGVPYRGMENRDSGIHQLLKVRILKAVRRELPSPQLLEVQCQQAQHVDHSRAANQVHRESRVLDLALGKKTQTAAVDHRRTDDRRHICQEGTTGQHWLREPSE